ESRRVPEPATAVDVGVLSAPEILRDGVEVPPRLAGRGVERPKDTLPVALVERLRIAGDRRDVHGVVEHTGRHVDALVGVAGELLRAPDLLAGVLVERE